MMLFVYCAIFMALGSCSSQWPWPSQPFYRSLVTPNRRYFMHLPNVVIHHRSRRPELLRPVTAINGLYHPYYFDPSLKNTIPVYGPIQPTPIFPTIDDESLGETEKTDTEIVDVEDVADTTNTEPKDKEQTIDNDRQEVEIDEMGNDDNELPTDVDRNHFYQYYYLRAGHDDQPQFPDAITRADAAGTATEPIKLTRANNARKTIPQKMS